MLFAVMQEHELIIVWHNRCRTVLKSICHRLDRWTLSLTERFSSRLLAI